jgi:hypothetical protein
MTPLQKADLAYWQSIQDSNDPALFTDYLTQFPKGMYAMPARAKLGKLTGQSQQVASAAPAAPAQPLRATTTPAAVETASAAPVVEDDGVVPMEGAYLATKSANIRAEPHAKAKVLGKLKADESVTVTGRSTDGEWLQVATGAGSGFVSAKLLKVDPSAAARVAPPAPAPAPEPEPVPQVNTLRIADSFRQDIETFLNNSQEQKSNYRFLAVSSDGARIGISTGCKKMKTSWGGWAAEGCSEEAKAKEIALEKCGDDCRIIYNGVNKVGDFEIEWQ